MEKIINRLAQYIERKGISLNAFDKSLGLSNGYIGKQIKNNASIGGDVLEKISCMYTDLSLDWLIAGAGDMLKSGQDRRDYSIIAGDLEIVREKGAIPRGAVPYWELPVSAGRTVLEIVGKHTPDGYIKGLPGIEQVENILPVQGMSMEPEVSEGGLIGVRKMATYETLNTERLYLIITTEDRMIKRIEHDLDDQNILWCVSPNYPKFKIYKTDIIDIQRVCFVFNPK